MVRKRDYVNPMPGSTYAVTTEPFDGWVKLGRSSPGVDPTNRLRVHQTGNARQLRMRVVWPIDVERGLHNHYAAFRGKGEWFALPWRLVDDMRRFKDDPKPWVRLFDLWTRERIYAEARFAAENVKRRPEWLARAFMTVREARRTAETRRQTIPITDEMVERALNALRPDLKPMQHVCRFDRTFGRPIPGCGCDERADRHEWVIVHRALEYALRGIPAEEAGSLPEQTESEDA